MKQTDLQRRDSSLRFQKETPPDLYTVRKNVNLPGSLGLHYNIIAPKPVVQNLPWVNEAAHCSEASLDKTPTSICSTLLPPRDMATVGVVESWIVQPVTTPVSPQESQNVHTWPVGVSNRSSLFWRTIVDISKNHYKLTKRAQDRHRMDYSSN